MSYFSYTPHEQNMNIENYREEIDKINIELIDLLCKRTKLAKKIGQIKKEQKLPIRNKKREKEMLQKLKSIAKKKNIDEQVINNVFKTIIEYTIQIEKGE